MHLRVSPGALEGQSFTHCSGQTSWIWSMLWGCIIGSVWSSSTVVSSSSGSQHEHHFYGSKHHSVPISIYRSPASLRIGNAGTTFIFGRGGGLITYTWPTNDRPSTRSDRLTVGFSTSVKDAILARVDSAPGLGDFLQLHIQEGMIAVLFNIGTMDISIKDTNAPVNDGKYHVVRFNRNGGNATLQLDNWPVNEYFPTGNSDSERLNTIKQKIPFKYNRPVEEWLQEKGRQLTIFNTQAKLSIGGNDRGRPFQGQLSGLYYNGLKVLNMAAEKHPNIKINGSVRQVGEVPSILGTTTTTMPEMSTTIMETTTTMATTTSRKNRSTPSITTTDDIVSSAECASDDEDIEDCEPSTDKSFSTPDIEFGYKAHAPKWEHKNIRPKKPSETGRTTTTSLPPELIHSTTLSSPGMAGKMNNRELKPQPDIVLLPMPTAYEIDSTKLKNPLITSPMFRNVPTANPTEPGIRRVPGASEVVRESSSTTGMVVGIVAAAALCILILLYAMYKYRNRDEGSYQVDEARNYISNSAQSNGTLIKEKQSGAKSGHKKQKNKDKEYYV
ncbi:neurexin-3-beta-like isoform X4 [Protopterus annectens]|uniref:neurexin-3-beta-like isoform X4 n=1 Tax=Protopterus annectens TaxID=7888 RepID=UPI001CFB7B3B|nr:neurexin-3-beta-like isoform X4 [Protopterus annectens]